MSLFDVIVIASVSEGHPQTLLEAMAVGKAVVATDVGGISEILRDGETGLLVPPQDFRAMADKIIYLFQNDIERGRLAAEARTESGKFSIAAHTRMLENVYQKMAGWSLNDRAGP